jgi:DNA-binding transcriptional ArsR family regulator
MRLAGGLLALTFAAVACHSHAPPAPAARPAPAPAHVVDDGRTAWDDWTAAGQLLAPDPPRSPLSVLSVLLHDRMGADEEKALVETARGLLQPNQRALERAAAGTDRTRCVIPATTPRARHIRAGLQVQTLAYLLLLRATVAARTGAVAAAVVDITRALTLARLLVGCQGTLADLAIAAGVSEHALRAARWLTRRPMDDASRAALTRALEAQAVGEAATWAALQAAARRSLQEVEDAEAQTPAAQAELLLSVALQRSLHGEAAKVVDAGFAELLARAGLPAAERQGAEALRARLTGPRVRTTRRARAVLRHLLERHPRRFLAPETRARLQAGVTAMLALAGARAEGWERALADAGRAAVAELRREPALALAICVFPGYFRDGIPDEARDAFITAENLLGRYEVAVTLHQLAEAIVRELAESQAQEAQRAVLVTALALLRYEARHGALPRHLAALTAAGLLTRVPRDPYSRAALRYRPADRKVWSLGADRKDDGGSFEDTVFRLPPR